MIATRRVLVLFFLLSAAVPASAQLAGRPAEEWIKNLDGETRVASLKIDEVVAAMKLQPGQAVADIGAGSGLLSVPVAKAVGPNGRVYAVEIDKGFFPAILKRAADAGVTNVQTVLGEFTDPKLPATGVNVAFFHDVLHHVQDRAAYLKTLARYLPTGGRIVVIDFEGGKGPHLKQPELQVSREQLTAMMRDAGLRQADEAKLFDEKYVLTFVKN
jgi:ubiquinone/menaquinone biosynthesis C-methylase UbiE